MTPNSRLPSVTRTASTSPAGIARAAVDRRSLADTVGGARTSVNGVAVQLGEIIARMWGSAGRGGRGEP
jgi:hypothetical protein